MNIEARPLEPDATTTVKGSCGCSGGAGGAAPTGAVLFVLDWLGLRRRRKAPARP